MRPSPITATVDFAAPGKQHGFLRLPYSRDDSAWGSVTIPIAVVRGAAGPAAHLVTGRNDDMPTFTRVVTGQPVTLGTLTLEGRPHAA